MRRKDKEVQFLWQLLFSDANATQIRPQNLCDKRDNGQVHCTAHAHLSKCCFATGTCCIVFASHRVQFQVHLGQQNGQRVLETSLKNKKDGGRSCWEIFLAFQDFFWKFCSHCLLITRSGQTQRETRQPVFIVLHGLKDFRMSRFQVVPFTISANFGFHLCVKIHTKMAQFLARF